MREIRAKERSHEVSLLGETAVSPYSETCFLFKERENVSE
jgi:hypothetical protein